MQSANRQHIDVSASNWSIPPERTRIAATRTHFWLADANNLNNLKAFAIPTSGALSGQVAARSAAKDVNIPNGDALAPNGNIRDICHVNDENALAILFSNGGVYKCTIPA